MNDLPPVTQTTNDAELIRSVIVLAVDLVLASVSVYIMKNPDSLRMGWVRTLHMGERICQSQAKNWAALADVFEDAYRKSRLTVV